MIIINKVGDLFKGNALRAQLLRGGLGSIAVMASQAMLTFGVAVVLARVLGPEGYGIYSFALAIVMLIAIPAQVGVPQLIIRETAKAQASNSWGLIRGLWRWGNITVLLLSLLSLFLLTGLIFFTDLGGDGDRLETLTIGIILIPIIALGNVRGACLRGLRKVVHGQLPEGVIRPASLLLLVGVWFLLVGADEGIEAQTAMGFYVAAALVAFLSGAYLLRLYKPTQLINKPEPIYKSLDWRKAVIPLALIAGLQLINNFADLIILGLFRSDDEVGIYRAVSQLSLLVVFGLQAINQVLHPYFARLHAQEDKLRLQRLVTISSRLILLLALLPFLVFLFVGNSVLEIIFGTSYAQGAVALAILAAGQLANAAFGSVGALLNMTGHERDTMRGMIFAMGANVILNVILIPLYGMNGAATATALSYFLWNAILRHYVQKRLSIESAAFVKV